MVLSLRHVRGVAFAAAGLLSATAAPAQNGKDPFQGLARGYGVRTLGQTTPVDGNTIFAIGSSSKAFTAAAIGILVDEGKANWDDPVTKYLPEFEMYDPYASKEMRLRDLVTPRSGLMGGDLLWYGTSSARLEHWHFDTFRARWSDPTSGTTMLTFNLGGDAKVRNIDVEGLGLFQRAPERPR